LKTERRIELLPLSKLKRAKRNPKLHAEEAISASFSRHGFVEPLVRDERTGRLVAGHGRAGQLEAAFKAEPGKPPAGVEVKRDARGKITEWLVPVVCGWRSKDDAQAEAYLLASNRTTELGGWDDAALAKMLESFDPEAFVGSGFSDADLRRLIQEQQPANAGSLSARFIVPPFTILDARQGYWQERKQAWLALGIESEEGRAENMMGLSEAMRLDRTPGGTPSTSVFDPVLCELVYRWFARPGFRVLDPFAGGSVRGIVAAKLGLRYTGVELRKEQVQANKEQGARILGKSDATAEWIEGDSRTAELPGGAWADLLFSCPPYGNLEVYSDDERDLSAMSESDFEGAYAEIIARGLSLLKPNRFACFVVGDYRRDDGFYQGLPQLTIDCFERAGAKLYNEAVLVTAVGTLSMRVAHFFPRGRKLGKSHQNVLVFFKGDPERIGEELGELEIPPESLELLAQAEAGAKP
jgi:DNA modification methylase